MMINCEIHGYQNGVQVSPDLAKLITDKKEFHDVYSVNYEFEGEVVDLFYISKLFAEQYGLKNKSLLPLPDEYPEWVMSLKIVCEKCFNAFNKSPDSDT